MDALPDELVYTILGRVNARTLVAIGSLSTRYQKLTSSQIFSSLAITDARLDKRMGAWIRANAKRIQSLASARCSFGRSCLEWARDVPLASLTVLYGRIAPSALLSICPDKLASLILHQIAPDIYHESFAPRTFQKFIKLRHLDVTFSSMEYIEVAGLQSLVALETLCFRNAYVLDISTPFPPNLVTVRLKAYIMIAQHSLPTSCCSATLECSTILPLEDLIGPEEYNSMYDLHIASPLTMRIACIERMPALHSITCRSQIFIFGREWIAAAKSVRVASVHASLTMCTELWDMEETMHVTTAIEIMQGTQQERYIDIKAFLLDVFL
jgi:hypothetical protein